MDTTTLTHPATVASATVTAASALQGANWQTLVINAGFTLLMHAINAFVASKQKAKGGGSNG